jgi:hypothetical protein
MKVLEVGQQNGMSPQKLYREAIKVFMASDYYQELVKKTTLQAPLE